MIEQEALLVDIKESESIYLNQAAAFIWEKLDGNTSIKKITQSLSEEFGIDNSTAEKDIQEFITSLLEKKLIHA